MMLIPLWLRLAAGAALAGVVLFGGYKIGAWKEAAAGAEAAKEADLKLDACNASLATQRETDLTGANHALADQLQDATKLAHEDAQRVAELATKMQRDALTFGANTRAFYEVSLGNCSFTPDFVGLLIRASDQANSSNRNSAPDKASAPKAGVGDGHSTAVPDTASRPRDAAKRETGPNDGHPVE